MSILGCDISDDQTVTSFHDVLASGISFVVCKSSQNADSNGDQDTFADYRDRIRSVSGLTFGAYHYLGTSDGAAQAAYFFSKYTPQAGDLVPMFDCEETDFLNNVGPDQATTIMAAFAHAAETHIASLGLTYPAATGTPGRPLMLLYTDYASIQAQRFHTDEFAGHPLWIAEYNSDNEPTIPQTWPKAVIWQYSDGGGSNPPGITASSTDRDRFLGPDLSAYVLRKA